MPVRHGVRVDRVTRDGKTYVVEAGNRRYEAAHVVVAMATFQEPRVPAFAAELHGEIVQIHSRDYRSPNQFREGGVLVVGAGNSGAEIALEAARHGHRTWMSGRDTGYVPFRVDGAAAVLFLTRLVLRGVFHRLLTVDTPLGRRARPKVIAKGGPLIRVKPGDLAKARVERVARVGAVRNGLPLLEDGRVIAATNVVWCTGFHPGFSWIDLPVFAGNGEPRHDRGIVPGEPGLYFVGLHFLYALSSTMVHGVGRDAERIARTITERSRTAEVKTRLLATPAPVGLAAGGSARDEDERLATSSRNR
jgi:putative flavoprotein involved in K+ transport